jgi:hypothetical protein
MKSDNIKDNIQSEEASEITNPTFWVICAYFNPSQSKNMHKRYIDFYNNLKKQGANILCVELTFGNNKPELLNSQADILINRKSNAIMWQKERLLNIGLENLPTNCDKFSWVDIDIKFEDPNWINKTKDLLNQYCIVQPYSVIINLSKNKQQLHEKDLTLGLMDGQKSFGFAYGIKKFGKELLTTKFILNSESKHMKAHPGYAWAARRSVFKNVGLYDRLILGSADALIAHGFYGNKNCFLTEDKFCSESMQKDQHEWIEKIYKNVKGSVGFLEGNIYHVWHGSFKNRLFEQRREILKKHNFQPKTDIHLDNNKCWRWSSDKHEMHLWIKKYFWYRNEDGKIHIDIIRFFKNIFENIIERSIRSK